VTCASRVPVVWFLYLRPNVLARCYLVAVAAGQTRAHLCDFLWDGPDDPRAALRWSLTKLRPVVNDKSGARLEADRERVQFLARGARVDVLRVTDLLADGPGRAGLEALEEAATLLLRGEFLDGLDMPRCYRFHHWCMAERERMGALRRQVLGVLIARLKHHPERVLPYARASVATDPLSEAAHAVLVEVLAEGGRTKDAEAHYAHARDLLKRELAAPLNGELQRSAIDWLPKVRGSGRSFRVARHPEELAPPGEASLRSPAPFVGHRAGRRKIGEILRSLAEPSRKRMLVFLGEPGIGKTRLLQMAIDGATRIHARVISARCFEAEMVRPYGIWVDALRAVPPGLIPEKSKQDLALLCPMPEVACPEGGSRERLFGAVVDLVEQLGRERPLIAAFDDLQWIDEGSASLLHFAVRTLGASSTLFVATARKDEVEDNPWAKRLLQSLERERCIDQVPLAPLDRDETAALLGPGTPPAEVADVYRESGGNPLFILELAHAKRSGGRTSGRTVEALIDERVGRLDAATREVIAYAAVIGREFRPEILAASLGLPAAQLIGGIERLEHRGLLRPTLEEHYDFCHDLVRQTTYRRLSQPRRRMIHRQIAAALSQAAERDGSLYGDLVHHAALADDCALAARACVAAGDRCLRMFANSEAETVAGRGLSYLRDMPRGADRTRLQVALLNLRVQGAYHIFATVVPARSQVANLLTEIQGAADDAEAFGLSQDAAFAYHLKAWLTWRSNESDTAQAATLEAERTSRTAADATRCLHLANTGRCLLDVEADIERARRFVQEAASLAAKLDLHVVEIEWGLGLIARWEGDLDRAHRHMERAITLAASREDRWRQIECMLWLAKIELELRRYDEAIVRSNEVIWLAERIGGANAPIAKALRFLADLHKSCSHAGPDVVTCLVELRNFDDKANLAYFLNECARFELACGSLDAAEAHAREALAAARAVRRTTEVAVAHAVLARIAQAAGDSGGLSQHVAALTSIGDPERLSARARSQMLALTPRPDDSNAHSNADKPRVDVVPQPQGG
jgi:DNA-binding SARP family transcriptional activator/tetratricopeptide (TPR) repeat protein